MSFFKKLVKIVIILFLFLLIGISFYVFHLKPTYKGNISLKNLNEKVNVYFDDYGVPHIYADNQEDAYTALGYVHAQDRLWQMELIRRIGAGRLSEILGKDFIETDKFFLTMGIEDAALKTIDLLDKNSNAYKLAQAYLNGINQFIDEGATPIEYTLIGVNKEHFTIKDIYNVYGYMSFSFAMAHKTDPFISKLYNKLDASYIEELVLDADINTIKIPIYNKQETVKTDVVSNINEIIQNLPIAPFIGSNAWVVGVQKTLNGKVIFSNDPHIKYSQPAVWYQSHIVCPDFELYGFNLALTPFSLLGHNHEFAYGLTMFENDDIDFYAEKVNNNKKNEYLLGDKIMPLTIQSKTIKVKDANEVVFDIKRSIHGPIMNDYIGYEDSKTPISMDWIYTKFNNEMLEGTYQITHSKDLVQFKEGVSKIVAPGLNVMYGDAKDNIAWFAAAKLYKHDFKVNTKTILDGSNLIDDRLTYIDFKDNPQSINPPTNYVYSANNQPDVILDSLLYPGYYLPQDRAKRITDVLDDLTNISIKDMKSLVNDVTSSKVPELVKIIIANIDESILSKNETDAIRILKSWKGNFDLNEIAPTIYVKFKYLYLKNIFEDELGEKDFKAFLETHIVKKQYNKQLTSKFSVWNDDINTPIIEDKTQIITKSFKEAIVQLEKQLGSLISEWTWKTVHTVEHEHPIGKSVASLRKYFNVGPFAIKGSNEVLNNQIFSINPDGIYNVTAGPSTRRIVDFSDVENNSFAILPTGQSGNVFSKHYKDQAQMFVNGEFMQMLLNKEKIISAKDKLTFSPKN